MNFFGNDSDRQLTVAKMEADIMTDMFNKWEYCTCVTGRCKKHLTQSKLFYYRMSGSCAKKCVVKYSDGDLNVAEMLCVDRCVGKYMQAQEAVGNTLRKYEEQLKALEASGVKSPNYITPKH